MSQPKLAHRRIGFRLDKYGRPRSRGRSGAWSASILHEARWAYLQCLSRECPAVLTTLRNIAVGDDDALEAWMRQWALVSTDPADNWTLAHARATQAACAQYNVTCWFDRDDLVGVMCPQDDSSIPQESRPLRHAEHFVWLARRQLGADWARITDGGADTKTVQQAVTSLAHRLRLQLRPTRRGRRPTKK